MYYALKYRGLDLSFCEHQEAVVGLSMRDPLHCTSQGVLVFNIKLETLLRASSGSNEPLIESFPAQPHKEFLSSS